MSEAVLTNGICYLAEYDLSGQINAIAADMSAEAPESTAMVGAGVQGYKARLGGLKDTKVSLNGYFESEPPLFNSIGLINSAMTIGPSPDDASTCFIFQPAMAKYTYGGKIGDTLPYKVEGEGAGPFVSGTILLPKLARVATNTGTGRQLGAASASQTVYGVLHVFAASVGDTLDVVVQSDAANTFLSPTDVITFAQKTAVGHEWKTAAGTVSGADTWWRISFTIGGVDPSFTFCVAMGIL